ncbi:MAG: PKD domain-containing protein, partial [Flavobacteriales bacterium]
MLLSFLGSAQSDKVFIENKGQWDSRIEYNQILADGNLFLEQDGFTYSLYEKSYIQSMHDDKTTPAPSFIKSHAIKTKFLNANSSVVLKKEDESSFYYNYFMGDDKSQWKSEVRSTSKVTYQNLYQNIDLSIYTEFGSTKYDFIVKPGANESEIRINYLGADDLYLQGGKLIIENTINNIEEAKPFAYQLINGNRVKVPCKYVLHGSELSFEFPNGYDKTKELIIDPIVVFSTYSGSTADNFGFTATYDNNENTYAGGIVFGTGVYPVTIGAHQTAFNAAPWYYVDIAISKFNANGTNLLYSTYLGGSNSEAPHSLAVNDNNELFVMGTTGSRNYPTTIGAYDGTFGAGVDVRPLYSGIYYFQGSDIFVTKFNVAGTTLLGSTFVGGSGNDGVNTDALLAYNYGDAFRGEITIDSSGSAIVTSTTNSTNFPTTAGAPQTTYGGGFSDACMFVLDSGLQNLSWSTYFGGSAQDAGYGVQFDSQGNYFMTGGTMSSNLVTSTSAYDRTYNGNEDGYIAKFNANSNSLLASTYIGTNGYDQSFMVQLDNNDDVYIAGQSLGSYPVTSGVFSNPGSSQFFHKLSNNLDSSYWSTVIGSGRNTIDLSPSAFLVNNCGLIYLSGWGGVSNTYYRAAGSSTNGLPLTGDAYQSTTDGSDFYLMVLDRDATSLRYGTYYGGAVSHEHVDGGTSRFDKKGNVYQAVCAGCGGNSDLPTTPGSWSRTNNSTNCNLGVIKMNIAYIQSIASSPAPFICLPDSVNFVNNSSGGNSYKWYFGDGDSSSLFQPIHVYPDTGIYNVTLIVYDSLGCVPADTGRTIVYAYKPQPFYVDTIPVICRGDSIQLNSYNGNSYNWTPSASLTSDSVSNPIAFPNNSTTYKVTSTHYCSDDSAYVTVVVDTNNVTVSADTTICRGTSITLSATGGATYAWYPALGLGNGTTANPTVTP